jgi:sugar O-acyltransferase (sialic acid O-acetyltransferase NeuD family)
MKTAMTSLTFDEKKDHSNVKKNLYILGAGGFAKEVYFLAKEIGHFEMAAFVDLQIGESIVFTEGSIPVIADSDLDKIKDPNMCLAIGIGDPKIIERLRHEYLGRYDFPNLIHLSVIGDFPNIEMGQGNIITANVVFTTHITIGDMNIFNLNATIGHDAQIGSGNVVNPSVNISGGVSIGDFNMLGVSSVILQYKKIADYAVIGACALVNKDVESHATVVGIPAKKIS